MRRMRRILFIGLLGILLAAFAWSGPPPSEPSYHDEPLKYWLGRIRRGENGPNPEDPATKAIRAMGSKTFPFLLQYAAARGTSEDKICAAEEDHMLAERGFYALGTNALPAVPTLIRLLKDDDVNVRRAARGCLGELGPCAKSAVPAMLKLFKREAAETNDTFPAIAFTLAKIGANADEVIPILKTGLTNQSSDCRFNAQAALLLFGVRAPQEFYWQLTNLTCKDYCGYTLAACGTNAAPAVPVLVSGLKLTNDVIQKRCLDDIAAFHQQPKLCVPAVSKFLESSNEYVRIQAIQTLRAFKEGAKQAGPAVAKCLNDPSEGVRWEARYVLPFIDLETAKKNGLPKAIEYTDNY